tara:strand:- start:678 stop:1664 length:987 start_codon:yes stop_codon:yes gene_type:complete
MKFNAENIVLNSSNYHFDNKIVFISGNEIGFITKIEELVLKSIKLKNEFEKIILDSKNFDKDNFLEQINNRSFFSNYKIVHVTNLTQGVLDFLEKLELKNLTIIISAAEIKSSSKIKRYFDMHNQFYSISCYNISENFKKKFIENFITNNNVEMSDDAYWYLLHNISDKYKLLESELEKLSNFSNEKISLREITLLLSNTEGVELNDLFFDCVNGNKNQIIISSQKKINSSSDAYLMLQIIKNFSKILISTSEKKSGSNFSTLVNQYLPKYLFMRKKNFEELVKKINFEKLVLINALLQKTEIYLRKDNDNYLMIMQRFLLNYSKIIG